MNFRQLAIELFVMAAIGAVLALLGPFGTYAMPVALRLAYWIGFILIGYAIFRPVQTAALWLAEETLIPRWSALMIAGALASLPLTGLIGFAIGGMTTGSRYLGSDFPILYLQVAGIGYAILFLTRAIFREAESEAPASPAPPPKPLTPQELALPQRPDAPFFDRLPPELGDHLVCLEMQDHYVKAYTLKGAAMILMRLKDAMAELDGVEGMQVHRSWWVAREHVRGVDRDGRKMGLELANGMIAPVSRNRQADLKTAGWI
ncbi:MAG: LytTR family DNA-binding domain-containing protein [Parasphingopyxis sp.]|uniref:LytTR family DNA-binding domain-containing protein n=1 Tax=Parasphingopyxis sp. TaxID=1920299 RepID=UPI002622B19C|nr:LytTR family DNA-binding domain-containing protein [uncultured Parasphingopyxis sp.]